MPSFFDCTWPNFSSKYPLVYFNFINRLPHILYMVKECHTMNVMSNSYCSSCKTISKLFHLRDFDAFFFVGHPKAPVIVDPPIIVVPPWHMFEFVCSTSDGSRVEAYFSPEGGLVRDDSRFTVRRYNITTIIISAPEGLRDNDDVRIE